MAYSTQAPSGPSSSAYDQAALDDEDEDIGGAEENEDKLDGDEADEDQPKKKKRKIDSVATSSAATPSVTSESSGRRGPNVDCDYFPTCFPLLFGLMPLSIPSASSSQDALPPASSSSSSDLGAGAHVRNGKGLDRDHPDGRAKGRGVSMEQARSGSGVGKEESVIEFPRSVSFKAGDWTNERLESDDVGYDVILA